MDNLKINCYKTDTIYIGNTISGCYKAFIADLKKSTPNIIFCELWQSAPVKYAYSPVDKNGERAWAYKSEYIFNSTRKFSSDKCKCFIKRREARLQKEKAEGKENYDIVNIREIPITDEVLDSWCRDTLGEETLFINSSTVLTYEPEKARYTKYTIYVSHVHNCDTKEHIPLSECLALTIAEYTYYYG